MNGIEGTGGTASLRRLLIEAAQSIRGATERNRKQEAPENKSGVESALSLSRQHLSAALQGAGFLDIHAGSIARMEAFLKHVNAKREGVEVELDPETTGDIATQMGSEVTGDVNLILRILARLRPERVAMLLK
ncbi:MAG: hypothetical protein JSW27_24495 [Phycisphaerales bacterium]|nr:MAG: hypothetical protein JSW27_24495 [Phycisphaerales bacterium]